MYIKSDFSRLTADLKVCSLCLNMECRLRPLVIKYSNITNPDGSALLCQGNTIVQVYVYGPVEVSSSKEHSDRASLFVAYKPKNSCNKCK